MLIDIVKKYWNDRPCNIKHSDLEIGTKDYFDQVEKRKYFVESHIPNFADFNAWKGKKVLEIGCGIGTDSINFARAGAIVTSVDLSKNSLKLAKTRAEVFGLSDRITFYQANAEDLIKYVPIDTYDLVYSFGVIHHTPNPSAVIQSIKKYMGPESILKIMVYNRFSWKVLWILLKYGNGKFWKLNKLISEYSEAQTGCPVTYSYTRTSLRDLLKDFYIHSMFVDHIFPYSIPEYKRYQYKKVWYFRFIPPFLFKKLEGIIGWHLCVTCGGYFD